MSFGFTTNKRDPSLFIYIKANTIIYFLVYVDDLFLIGININLMNTFIATLSHQFSLKKYGHPSLFLGYLTHTQHLGPIPFW